MMNDLDYLFSGKVESWIHTLPAYQRRHIEDLIEAGKTPEEIASVWLSANVENTVPFGADRGKSLFLEKVWAEIEKFLCVPEEYSAEKEKLRADGNITHKYFVGVLSAAIAPTLGTSAVFLAPVIAMLLSVIGAMSIRAWCESRKEQAGDNSN